MCEKGKESNVSFVITIYGYNKYIFFVSQVHLSRFHHKMYIIIMFISVHAKLEQ